MFALRLHFPFFSKRSAALQLGCLFLLTLCLATGCSRSEPIRAYTPPELERGSYELDRMLVAIVPIGESTWFFKMQGTDEPVYKHQAEFDQFLQTIRAPKSDSKNKATAEPTWTAPPEWTSRRPSNEMIKHSFQIPNGKGRPLTLEISTLPTPETGVDELFLHQNINRWCRQYGNEGISEKEVDEYSEKIALKDLSPDGGDAWIVNLSGHFAGRSGMAGPMNEMAENDPHAAADNVQERESKAPGQSPDDPHAGLQNRPKPDSNQPQQAPVAESTRVKVTIPPDWKQGRASSIIRREVSLASADGALDISLMALPADANDLATNISRWRGQVGLAELPPAELIKQTQKITVDGAPGDLVELVGDSKTILAAMVKKGNEAWFFKLIGPKESAAKEKAKFEEFVRTTKLP